MLFFTYLDNPKIRPFLRLWGLLLPNFSIFLSTELHFAPLSAEIEIIYNLLSYAYKRL